MRIFGTLSYFIRPNSVLRQWDPERGLPSLHLPLRSGHLFLGAAVLQKHSGQAAQARALREGEAQHALQDGWIGDLRAGRRRHKVHECGDGRQDGLLAPARQTVCDQVDPSALQDDSSGLWIHAQVTQSP